MARSIGWTLATKGIPAVLFAASAACATAIILIELRILAPAAVPDVMRIPVVSVLPAMIGMVLYCSGEMVRTDPRGWVSIVSPIVMLIGLGVAVRPWLWTSLFVASLYWAAWTFAPKRIWPWWSRHILRRRTGLERVVDSAIEAAERDIAAGYDPLKLLDEIRATRAAPRSDDPRVHEAMDRVIAYLESAHGEGREGANAPKTPEVSAEAT